MSSLHSISSSPLSTLAVVMEKPEQLRLCHLDLTAPGEDDIVVDMEWSGISTGTEKLLWFGRMPAFPGLGYPLVPGYESVGRISHAGATCGRHVGERVFVPGARCYGEVRGLFGGASSKVVVPGAKVTPIDEQLGERGVLLALAATAHHAISGKHATHPELIVGHGVLGRLIARIAALNTAEPPPVVWERNPTRAGGASGYTVIDPALDKRKDYRSIVDVSGDGSLLDTLIARLAPGGEVVLAGFYDMLTFTFPAAFMREARIRVAAEWRESDLHAVKQLIESGRLNLDGLITHRHEAADAQSAYATAFNDPNCLKMILDWRAHT